MDTDKNDGRNITLTLNGYYADDVQERVANLLAERANQEMGEAIKLAVKRTVDEEIRKYAAEVVKREIDAIVADGWQPTDQWGDPRGGPKVTLRQRLNEILNRREQYGSGLAIDKMAMESINAAVKKEIDGELAGLRERFRSMVDDVLKAKFSQAMRDAVGLK